MRKQPSPLSDPDANKSNPWRTEGLFSTHFLVQRFAQSGSAHWPGESESNEAFDRISVLLSKNEYGLRKGNEEDCEDRFISPVLDILGFAYANRKIIPEADRRALPDYLLYGSQESVDAAFHAGRRESYYIDCLGLLEAKRWAHNLSEDASGRGKAAKGRSPHHQIRDYLSDTDRLVWGILTNGEKWRLYCKHDRASSFFEFDLRSAVVHNGSSDDESRARSQFRFFFGLFRAAMFSREPSGACPLDELRSGAERFRADVEARLRTQVFDCVELLGKGLLDSELNSLTKDDLPAIYENSLILLYRILFVLNAEARDLLPTHESNERARTYFHSYGLEWVRRKLSDPGNAEYADNGTFTLYERLRALFTLINGKPPAPGKRDKNEELDIPRYNGGLFDPSRYPFLEQHKVGDSYLAGVLRLLSFRRGSDGETTAFDYASLGERHLGSIYEGLLEHHLAASESGEIALRNDRGERKNQGAYYTPADWVNYIVEHTLTPLLERIDNTQVASQQEPNESAPQPVIPNSPTVRNPATQAESDHRPNESAPQPVIPNSPTVRNPAPLVNEEREPDDSFANAVLNLNICDPAMGSAHFLVEATAFLAEAIAAHPTTAPRPEITTDGKPRLKSDGSGDPLCTQEAKLAYWKRRVVEACIYGVDLNPLAVELGKLSLWLKTVDRVPLNFLDHHLRCGNSLLGATLNEVAEYPEVNKKPGSKGKGGQLSLIFSGDLAEAVGKAISDITAIEGVPTDTHDAAKEKERLWREIDTTLMPRFRAVADLWVGPWFGADPGYASYTAMFEHPKRPQELRAEHRAALDTIRPFHWELEFPDIFFEPDGRPKNAPGFDAVIGNPPWERIKLQENEFFSARNAAIAHAPTAAERKKRIAALSKTDPELWSAYERARTRSEQSLAFVRRSGFFPLMGKGDTNLYAVFAEKALRLVHPKGRMGLLVPSGIATDDTTKEFFQTIVRGKRLAELLDFENREAIFEDVHRSFKFSIILVAGKDAPQDSCKCGFFLHSMEDLQNPERVFPLVPEDFRTFNPNTLTSPIFRRRRDAELTRKLYAAAPILILRDEQWVEIENPWGVSFLRMFDMTNDSGLFRTAQQLETDGFWLGAGNFYTRGEEKYLPLYEGKMVQMYDHRAAGIKVNAANLHRPAQEDPTHAEQYQDPSYSPAPQFWVRRREVTDVFNSTEPKWLLGYKDVTSPTNVRTMIPATIPFAGVGNTFCLITPSSDDSKGMRHCLLANLSSFALDFATRQKVGGQHLNFFIVEQLPILMPSRYKQNWHGVLLSDFIKERVLELTYTAHDMKGFAEEMCFSGPPFPWDEERRLHLKCQLDALYFHLYGLSRDEAGEILDTFPIVRRHDEAKYQGRYRTKDLILGYYNAYGAGNMDAWVKG